MADEYGYSERRNKGKEKKREKRKHPYRKGGGERTQDGLRDSARRTRVVGKKK